MYVCRFQNVVLRCPTPRLHFFLSFHWPSFRFLSFMAFLIPSIQFLFGLPCALFCFGIHFNAILGRNRILRNKIIPQPRNFPHLLEPAGSLPCPRHLPLLPILSQTSPFHTLSSYFFNTHFNTIPPSTPNSANLPTFVKFPYQKPAYVSLLPHSCHIPVILVTLAEQ